MTTTTPIAPAVMTTTPMGAALLASLTFGAPWFDSDIVADVVSRDLSSGTLDGFSDAVLLARIAGQDRVAFRIFYNRHAGQILAALRHLCRDPVMADDLLQDVFMAVWRKAGGYRPERGDVGGWLFTVSRNKVIDARRRGRLPLVDVNTGENTTLAMPSVERRELKLSLHRALGTLCTDERDAVTMTYLGGFTYNETAARLDVPLGTLKSRLRTGIQRLRRRLGEGV